MPDFATTVTRHLDGVTRRRRGLPAPQVLVWSPSRGIDYSYGDRALPFHGASIGKAATTALVMQLVDAGRLSLDTPVTTILGPQPGLFRGEPTVGQLLDHTSGVADHYEDRVTTGPPFQDLVVTDRDHFWTPEEMIAFTRDRQTPVGAPGEKFHYSNTGYLLAGRVLEEIVGEPFHQTLRTHLFEPYGMTDAWLMHREPGREIAPLWLGRNELSTARSVSLDWSGGGIAFTLDDLVRLSVGLRTAPGIEVMSTMRHTFRPGIRYGTGFMEVRFEELWFLLRGMPRPTGHIGSLSTHMFYDATHDTHIALNFHSTREMVRSFKTLIVIEQQLARM